MENLFNEIINCPNFLSGQFTGNPCNKILGCQSSKTRQFPEPWNGNIRSAKLLFISSNPSINDDEVFPDNTWEEQSSLDFFVNRFSKQSKWVKDELKPLMKDGNYANGYVRFWASVRKTAATLLNRQV